MGDANDDGDICRDYLRSVCTRGKNCKFRHPEEAAIDNTVVFCLDYQNRQCRRVNCKFVHCSREKEEYYKETGKLPPEDNRHGDSYDPDYLPACRDFSKGNCTRGMACKYRHISPADYEYEQRNRRRAKMKNHRDAYDDRPASLENFQHDRHRRYSASYDMYGYEKMSDGESLRELEEENYALRKQVEELRKKVNNLSSANEVLLHQNECLRKEPIGEEVPAVDSHATQSLNGSTAILSHPTPTTPAVIIGQTTAIAHAVPTSIVSYPIVS